MATASIKEPYDISLAAEVAGMNILGKGISPEDPFGDVAGTEDISIFAAEFCSHALSYALDTYAAGIITRDGAKKSSLTSIIRWHRCMMDGMTTSRRMVNFILEAGLS